MEEFKVSKEPKGYKITIGKTHVPFPDLKTIYQANDLDVVLSLINWLSEKGEE